MSPAARRSQNLPGTFYGFLASSRPSANDSEAVVSGTGKAAYFMSGGFWQLLTMNKCKPKGCLLPANQALVSEPANMQEIMDATSDP
jgi:hypothetical protein